MFQFQLSFPRNHGAMVESDTHFNVGFSILSFFTIRTVLKCSYRIMFLQHINHHIAYKQKKCKEPLQHFLREEILELRVTRADHELTYY